MGLLCKFSEVISMARAPKESWCSQVTAGTTAVVFVRNGGVEEYDFKSTFLN